jgi:hypothetical protein
MPKQRPQIVNLDRCSRNAEEDRDQCDKKGESAMERTHGILQRTATPLRHPTTVKNRRRELPDRRSFESLQIRVATELELSHAGQLNSIADDPKNNGKEIGRGSVICRLHQ